MRAANMESRVVTDPTYRLGRYRLIAEVGRGANGAVYQALDETLGREVAVKVLWPHLAAEPVFLQRFEREARIAARIDHPSVVRVLDVGCEGETPYLVLEFIRGETLRSRLEREGRMAPTDALPLFRNILEGLAEAHAQGLVHRDIKPGNILLEAGSGLPKIADFGLARQTDEQTSLTTIGDILGTPEYLAPEIARGEPPSRRADLYAIGVMLYRMLTGRLPFDAPTPVSLIEAHQRARYDSPSSLVPELGGAADAIISRFMAREPEDRYASCREAIEDLDRWLRGEEVLAGLPQAASEIDENLARRPPTWWRAVWNRIDTWVRFQVLEVWDRTEPTIVLLHQGLRGLETQLRETHRRYEEIFFLRERLARDLEQERAATRAADVSANTALGLGDEAAARAFLNAKVSRNENLAAVESELAKTEQTLERVRESYKNDASKVAAARHRSDLLLSRRRRAKLELSMLGTLPEPNRRFGERFLAAAKLFFLALLLGAAFSLGVTVATRSNGLAATPPTLAQKIGIPGFARFVGDLPADAHVVHVRAGAAGGGDGSADRPFRTVEEGIAATQKGGVVAVHSGEYDVAVELTKSITLVGEGADTVFFLPRVANKAIVTIASDARVRGICFRNRSDFRTAVGVFLRDGAKHPEISFCVFRNQMVAIAANTVAVVNADVDAVRAPTGADTDSDIAAANAALIAANRASDQAAVNADSDINVAADRASDQAAVNADSDINVAAAAENNGNNIDADVEPASVAPLIRNNVIYSCFIGMTVTSTTRPIFVDNIIYRNVFTVITDRFHLDPIHNPTVGPDTVMVRANLVYGNNTDFGFFQLYGQRNLDVSPALRSPATGDYRLAPGSPAIDAGDPAFTLLGAWSGTAPDIGAFEFDPAEGAAWARGDTIPGRLVYETEEIIFFVSDSAGNLTLRPFAPTAGAENPEDWRFGDRASTLQHGPLSVERLVAVGVSDGPWKGFAQLDFGMTAWLAYPGEEGTDNSVYVLHLTRPTLFPNALVITARAGPEIRIPPPDRLGVENLVDMTGGQRRLFASRTAAGTGGTIFSPRDNSSSFAEKIASLVLPAPVFTSGEKISGTAEASVTLHAAELTTEDLDRRRRLVVGDFVFEIEVTRFRYAQVFIRNEHLRALIPERRPFSRDDVIPYLCYVAVRVRCYYSGG